MMKMTFKNFVTHNRHSIEQHKTFLEYFHNHSHDRTNIDSHILPGTFKDIHPLIAANIGNHSTGRGTCQAKQKMSPHFIAQLVAIPHVLTTDFAVLIQNVVTHVSVSATSAQCVFQPSHQNDYQTQPVSVPYL